MGSFSILNVVVTNILKLNFNQTLSSNGSPNEFSDPTFMNDYMEVLTHTASITFLTGIIQLLLRCFCLAFVTTPVPKTLIDASLTAAASHVIVSQFIFTSEVVLDFHEGPLDICYGVLAAVVVFNVLPFLEKLGVPILWRRGKHPSVIWLVTFAAAVCFGLDASLAIAMRFTFFIITIRSHRDLMKMEVLGQIPNMNIYRSLSVYKTVLPTLRVLSQQRLCMRWTDSQVLPVMGKEIESVKILQCCSTISFANMNHFKAYLLPERNMKAVPLEGSEVSFNFTLSDTAVERKDLKCCCVCDLPLPPPRISFKRPRLEEEMEVYQQPLNYK
ncbi:LOW QUALITY PROTEIN: testis anion transporter 1 [Aegotheles albertisi]